MDKKKLIKALKENFKSLDIKTYINELNGKHETENGDYNFIVGSSKSSDDEEVFWISNVDNTPYIIFLIKSFYVYYSLGEKYNNIEEETPSIKDQPEDVQFWSKTFYAHINQAFIDSGYRIILK